MASEDLNGIVTVAEEVVSSPQSQQQLFAGLQNFFGFVTGMAGQAMALFQQNAVWAAVIVGLVWLLDNFILSKLQIKKGIIRYFLAFSMHIN